MGRESRGRNKRDKRNEQRHTRVHRKQRSGEEEREKGVENAVEERAVSLWSFRAPLQNPACICMVEDE